MKLSLKKLQVVKRQSEETLCFNADLCVDGKVVAMVSNNGRGGCNDYHWTDRSAIAPVEKWANEQKLTYKNYQGETTEVDSEKLDWIINDMIDKMQIAADEKRLCKNKTTFKLKGSPEGEYLTLKMPFSHEAKARMQLKYGDKIEYFLNERVSS